MLSCCRRTVEVSRRHETRAPPSLSEVRRSAAEKGELTTRHHQVLKTWNFLSALMGSPAEMHDAGTSAPSVAWSCLCGEAYGCIEKALVLLDAS